jgi:MFS family permease
MKDGPVAPFPVDDRTGRTGHRDLWLFWWAGTVDSFGSHVTAVALPVLLLGLDGSPAVVGIVLGAGTAVGLLTGPVAAVLADRGARKRVLVATAWLAAASAAATAVAVAWVPEPAGWVIAAFLVEEVATSCFAGAATGTVAMLCPPAGYRQAISRLQAGEQATLVVGPALGGLLLSVARWLPFAVDALTYVVAAVCVRAMRSDLVPPRDPDAPTARGVLVEIGAGLALVWRQPFLRLVLVWSAAVNGLLVALYLGAVVGLQDDGPLAVGLVLGIAGASGLVGALLAPRLAGRFGVTTVLVTVSWLLVAPAAGLAVATEPWQVGAALGAVCLMTPTAAVTVQARAAHLIPPHLQARAGSALGAVGLAGAALAPVITGPVTAWFGVTAMTSGCAVLLVGLAGYTSVAVRRARSATDAA